MQLIFWLVLSKLDIAMKYLYKLNYFLKVVLV